MMNKAQLRKKYSDIRKSISDNNKQILDNKIAENFLNSRNYKECNNLLVYISIEIEISTKEIIRTAFKEKNVYCPKCCENEIAMDFYSISSFKDLAKGKYGILEPFNLNKKFCDLNNTVCIVPALAYDLMGYRLGFGKGYYDRFLADFKGIKIGLGYEKCICSQLPVDKNDINVNKLITEDRIYEFSAG